VKTPFADSFEGKKFQTYRPNDPLFDGKGRPSLHTTPALPLGDEKRELDHDSPVLPRVIPIGKVTANNNQGLVDEAPTNGPWHPPSPDGQTLMFDESNSTRKPFTPGSWLAYPPDSGTARGVRAQGAVRLFRRGDSRGHTKNPTGMTVGDRRAPIVRHQREEGFGRASNFFSPPKEETRFPCRTSRKCPNNLLLRKVA